MGNVLPAGLGQAPARQAALGAGLPRSAEAVTVNKVCGSGMQAAIFATDMLKAGSSDVIVAGGMESMSNAPYLSKKYRSGARIGHDTVYDHMMLDGLEDAYEPGRAMGTFAEDAAREYQFTREQQDNYAIESLRRANDARGPDPFREVRRPHDRDHDEEPARDQARDVVRRAEDREDFLEHAQRQDSRSDADGAALTTESRLLHATERGGRVGHQALVHTDHAGLERVSDA